MGRLARRLRPALQDWGMRRLDALRPATLALAEGHVLEIGFGTALNLRHYPPAVASLTGVDPLEGNCAKVEARIARAPFPVERLAFAAGAELPFESGRFDTVVTTWTLCSIDEPLGVLAEMRRVLRPGGRYLFVEHGRSDAPRVARWQERLNPAWHRLADGCNIDRPIARLVREGGFELEAVERFLGRGPRILAEMYRGSARRAD